jgi:hypothetical protein
MSRLCIGDLLQYGVSCTEYDTWLSRTEGKIEKAEPSCIHNIINRRSDGGPTIYKQFRAIGDLEKNRLSGPDDHAHHLYPITSLGG